MEEVFARRERARACLRACVRVVCGVVRCVAWCVVLCVLVCLSSFSSKIAFLSESLSYPEFGP